MPISSLAEGPELPSNLLLQLWRSYSGAQKRWKLQEQRFSLAHRACTSMCWPCMNIYRDKIWRVEFIFEYELTLQLCTTVLCINKWVLKTTSFCTPWSIHKVISPIFVTYSQYLALKTNSKNVALWLDCERNILKLVLLLWFKPLSYLALTPCVSTWALALTPCVSKLEDESESLHGGRAVYNDSTHGYPRK